MVRCIVTQERLALFRGRLAVIEDSELPELRTLMSRYWDCPMDFAGASLVYLAPA
jgi:hypothetical protein